MSLSLRDPRLLLAALAAAVATAAFMRLAGAAPESLPFGLGGGHSGALVVQARFAAGDAPQARPLRILSPHELVAQSHKVGRRIAEAPAQRRSEAPSHVSGAPAPVVAAPPPAPAPAAAAPTPPSPAAPPAPATGASGSEPQSPAAPAIALRPLPPLPPVPDVVPAVPTVAAVPAPPPLPVPLP
jgi:hypothetical protein